LVCWVKNYFRGIHHANKVEPEFIHDRRIQHDIKLS
jgi:hypothetical protein